MLRKANEFDIYLLIIRKKKKSYKNTWLILEKRTEAISGRHQKNLPIWLWPLQRVHRCQESRAVITATRCMQYPHAFAFYFLYLQTEACPTAGCSLQSPESPMPSRALEEENRDAWASSPLCQSWLVLAHGCLWGPGSQETLFLKIQHHLRRQSIISRDAVRL